jgi:DNA gyrase subunit B
MTDYNVDSVSVLSNLDGVRKKPEMYIGSVGSTGIFQLVKEAIDNTVDEYFAGRNSLVQVVVGKNAFIVADNSMGIPVGKKLLEDDRGTYNISTLTAIFTKLHAGAKFGNHAYKTSAGTHGIGVKTITALSTRLIVYTCYRSKWYTQSFSKGRAVTEVSLLPEKPKIIASLPVNQTKGTILCWNPDLSIFGDESIDTDKLLSYIKDSSLLNKGLRFVVKINGKTQEFLNKVGIQEYVSAKAQEYNCTLQTKVATMHGEFFDLSFALTDNSDDKFNGYVNSSLTVNGGTHVEAFWTAYLQVLKPLMMKKHICGLRDLRIGIVGLLNWKMSEPKFSSQTKEKLEVPLIKNYIRNQIQSELELFFSRNKSMARQLLDYATELANSKMSDKQIAAVASTMTRRKGNILPGILEMATKAQKDDIELFIVEGDSAAGTAKNARFKEFQEVLRLKGKPINVAKSTTLKAIQSEPVQHILTAIGYDPKKKEYNLRVGKIMILADADHDGQHITSLVLTMLWTFCPKLFSENRIHVVDSPLFMNKYKEQVTFGSSLEDVRSKAPRGLITRLKGWGELDPMTLRSIAFDSETRKLYRIKPVVDDQLTLFQKIVGEDTLVRKQILGIVGSI